MQSFEYKTLMLPYKPSIFQSDSFDIQEALNADGAQGWKLSQILIPSSLWGRSNGVIAILERPKAS